MIGDYRGTPSDHGEGKSLAWKLRQPVVPVMKAGIRQFGIATAKQRVLPDFLMIGGKRTGSTSLYRNLASADDVLANFPRREDLKGTYYFDVEYARGADWYRSHFVTRKIVDAESERLGRRVVVGEASPYYLQHPHAAERAARLLPHAKVVATVRNPVDRAYSHYRERVRQGIETLPTFEAALDAEDARLDGELDRMAADPDYVSWNHLNYAYLGQSFYVAALHRWLKAFGPENVLVMRSEDLFADTAATIDRCRTFLGLEALPEAASEHFNNLPGAPIDTELRAELVTHFAQDQAGTANLLTPTR